MADAGVLDLARLLMKVAKNNGGKSVPMFRKGRALFEITGGDKQEVQKLIDGFVTSANVDGYDIKASIG